MKHIIFLLSILISFNLIGQSFTIQQNNLSFSGQPTNFEFSEHTFLEAISDDVISWNIVVDSIPSSWELSFCFPNCHNIGVTNGTLNILNGQDYLLNCHIYPNNTPGEGIIKMEITDGSGFTEQVSFHALVGSVSILDNYFNEKDNIKSIYNLNGQVVKEFTPNQIYIVQLKDGSFLKTFVNN